MIEETAPMGRRERKKLQTRQALADAALKLFLQRGYDAVTVAEIADAADTAVTTLFKHFPDGKESLIFGDAEGNAGESRGQAIAAAIAGRPSGTSVLDALEAFIADRGPFARRPSPALRDRLELIAVTPALRAYARQQWIEAQDDVAQAIAGAVGRPTDDVALQALVRFVLETPGIVGVADDPAQALHTVFEHLRAGWPAFQAGT